MTTEYKHLLPQGDPETQPYWDALKEHELKIQRCTDCSALRFPPQKTCIKCLGENVEWEKLSGRGTLYTYIIVTQPVLPQWREDVPYNIIQVALEEAPHIQVIGNAIGIDNSALKVGMPLEAVFDDATPEDTILRWKPRS
jgi:uncharacterized OB-fold protein